MKITAQSTIYSASGGDWADGSTWVGGSVPDALDDAVIRTGHTVSLATGAGETINGLRIMSGGVLDARNKVMTVTGKLIVNGTYTSDDNSAKDLDFSGDTLGGLGTIAVNDDSRSLDIASDLLILASTHLHLFGNINIQNNVSVTNLGRIEINGDLEGQNASSSIWIQSDNSELDIAGSLLQTGVLQASANGNSVTYFLQGKQDIKEPLSSTYYNLYISGSDTNTLVSDLLIGNDLHILSATLSSNNFNIRIDGDWLNESEFIETSGRVEFMGSTNQLFYNSSGEGFFDLTVNKSSGNLVLDGDVIVSNALNMTSGIIVAQDGKLSLGTDPGSPGAVVYSSGHIYGSFERWVTTTGTFNFPVGSVSEAHPLFMILNGFSSPGTVSVEFLDADPGLQGLPLFDTPDSVYNTFVDGYWDLGSGNGFSLGGGNDFNLVLDGTGFTAFTVNSSTRLLYRPDPANFWMAEGTHQSPLGASARRSGMTSIPAQYAFGDTSNCSRPVTSAISGTDEVCVNTNGVSYSVTNNPPNSYEWIIDGGTQASGGNTFSITVDWGNTGIYGSVRVIESNTCTQGAQVDFPVTVHSIQPAEISGRTAVAEYTLGEAYSISGIPGYSYNWTISGGIQNPAGNGSSITVDWDSVGIGQVSVTAQMPGCPVSASTDLEVNKYVIIESIKTGGWNDPSTWDCDCVPLPTENVRINNTHTVTLPNGQTAEVNNFIVEAGGTLFSNNKGLIVHGDFIINGTYQGGSKALVMDGFGSYIDGTGTVEQGISLDADIYFTTTAVVDFPSGDISIGNNIQVSNYGSVTVADNITGSNALSIWVNRENSTLNIAQELLNTGLLIAASSGNEVNYNGSGPQNIKVPVGAYAGLSTSGSGTKLMLGDLSINEELSLYDSAVLDVSGSNYNIFLSGNWNSLGGTFNEQAARVFFDGTTDQSIHGFEIFHELEFSGTGSLAIDTILIVSDSLVLSGGNIYTAGDTLVIGTGAGNPGSVRRTSGMVAGNVRRWISQTAVPLLFPVGDSVTYRPFSLEFTDLTSGTVNGRFVGADPGSAGLPFSEGSVNVTNQFTEGYWDLSSGNGFLSNEYDIALTAEGFSSYPLLPGSRVLKRDSGTDWILDGNHRAGMPPVAYRDSLITGISGLGTQFGIGYVSCPLITIDRLITPVSCNGGSDGEINISVSGGSTPYTYSWGHGPTTEDVSGLSAGTYDLTVTDTDGCTADSTFIVPEPLVLSADLDSIHVTCLGGNDGSILVSNPSGGWGTYEYSVNGDAGPWQGSGTFTGLIAGTYDVRIRDAAFPACFVILNPTLGVTAPNDTIPPIAVCQDTVVYLDASGIALIDSSYINGGSSDNCSVSAISIGRDTLTCSDLGINAVNVTVYDPSLNSATCVANVSVMDTIAPIISCPPDITEFVDLNCQFTLPDYTLLAGSSDNCSVSSIVQDPLPGTVISGHGTIQLITLTASDNSSNTRQCSFNITLNDTIPPVPVCLDTTIYLDAGGNASIDTSYIEGGSSDNCGISGGSLDRTNFTCADIGLNAVTYTVSDVAGNTSDCIANVQVLDTIAPQVICPGDRIEALDASCNFIIPDYTGLAGITENCSLGSLIQSPVAGTVISGHGSTQVISITATDGSGNSGFCSFAVTLADTSSPSVICKDTTVYLDASGLVSIDTSFIENGSVDNCGIASATLSRTSFSCADIGNNTVIYTVTDIAGNTGACISAVVVMDTISPVISCPADLPEAVDASENFIIPDYTSGAVASDNCSSAPALSQIPVPGTVINGIGTVQSIIITADDGNGNNSSCSFDITLVAAPPPTINCPGDQVDYNGPDCLFTLPDYTSLAITTNADTVTQSPAPGTVLFGAPAVHSIRLIAVNVADDSASCTFNLSILDSIQPVVVCPSDTMVTAPAGTCGAIVNGISPVSVNDNCSISELTFSITGATTASGNDDASGTFFNKGLSIVQYVIADDEGNRDSCSFNVTVLTNVIPPDSIFTDRDSICPGDGLIQLSYSGGVMVQAGIANWYDDPGLLNNIGTGNPLVLAAPSQTTEYFLRLEGTCDTTEARSVTVSVSGPSDPPDEVRIAPQNVCPGSGSVQLEYLGGNLGAGAMASWYADSSLSVFIGTGNILDIPAPFENTSYFVRFEGSCDSTVAVGALLQLAETPEAPQSASVDRDTVCIADGEIVLSYTGGTTGSGGVAVWSTDSLFSQRIGTGNDLVIDAPFLPTSYFVRFEADCDTTAWESVDVNIYPGLNPILTDRDVNSCGSGTLSFYAVLGSSGSDFVWEVSAGSIVMDKGDSIWVDWQGNLGLQEVSVYEVSGAGCSSDIISTFVEVGGPEVDLGPDQDACVGDQVEIIPSGSFDLHMWHDGSTDPTYVTDSSEQVKIQVFDIAGCSAADSVNVVFFPLPAVDLGPDTSLCGTNTMELDAGNPGADYLWTTGETTRRITVFSGSQTYGVEVSYGSLCKASDEILILDCSPAGSLANIPNLFTPNGDGKNDTWFFNEAAAFPDIVIEIFDRWGKLVYRSEPGYSNPWDGNSMSGQELPMDSYHYIIRTGGEEITGTITIVR